jgi:hypothetical protein
MAQDRAHQLLADVTGSANHGDFRLTRLPTEAARAGRYLYKGKDSALRCPAIHFAPLFPGVTSYGRSLDGYQLSDH